MVSSKWTKGVKKGQKPLAAKASPAPGLDPAGGTAPHSASGKSQVHVAHPAQPQVTSRSAQQLLATAAEGALKAIKDNSISLKRRQAQRGRRV